MQSSMSMITPSCRESAVQAEYMWVPVQMTFTVVVSDGDSHKVHNSV